MGQLVKGDPATIEATMMILKYRRHVKDEAKRRGVAPTDQVSVEGGLQAYLVAATTEGGGGVSLRNSLIQHMGISQRTASRYLRMLVFMGVFSPNAAPDALAGGTVNGSPTYPPDALAGGTVNSSPTCPPEVGQSIAVPIEAASITSNNYSTVAGFQKFWAGSGLNAVMAADDYLARCRDAGMGEVDAQKLAENFIRDRYYDDPDWMGPALTKWIDHRSHRKLKKSVSNGKEAENGKSGQNGAAGPASQGSRGKSRGPYSHLFRGKYK